MFNDIVKKKKKQYKIALCAFDDDKMIARVDFRTGINPDVKKECKSIFGLDLKEELIDIFKFELKADIDGMFYETILKKFVEDIIDV